MDWTQVFAIVGINLAIFALMATLIIWAVNKMDSDIKTIATRMDGHASRIDQLYVMFVDLLKETKK